MVAILDSGIDGDHPAVGGKLARSMAVSIESGEPRCIPAEGEGDLVGHGTACAGIVHSIAPEAELLSVQGGPHERVSSPEPGRSTLITVAPRSASSIVA